MSYVVALIGGIGSGKSTISHAFSKYGIDIIDADIIARQILDIGQPALASITRYFGQKILQSDGTLNRAILRHIIFNFPEEKDRLDRFLHPIIYSETYHQIMMARSPWCLWVVPLIVENLLKKLAHRILVVDVNPSIQIERTIIRDHITFEQARKIIASQEARDIRLSIADDVIKNEGNSKELIPIIAKLHQNYLSFASEMENNSINKIFTPLALPETFT